MTRNAKQQGSIERLAYSPGELAKALGISKTYAYSLVREGRIGSIRVGSRWLVPVREVEAFLASRAAGEETRT
jgi:excisionase family DNA binding protein